MIDRYQVAWRKQVERRISEVINPSSANPSIREFLILKAPKCDCCQKGDGRKGSKQMITKEQMQKKIDEYAGLSREYFATASRLERQLERENYSSPRDPAMIERLVSAYSHADYQAESSAWVLQLMQKDFQKIQALEDK